MTAERGVAKTQEADHAEWKPSSDPWMVAVSVMLATFMVVLDSSVANVALPHIAGNLSASTDESTWVLTSYLVSNAIMLPASGWIARRIGRKRLLMFSILLFTAASLLCGMAINMPMLIVARILQGAGGGGMQPLAQSILLESFPPEQARHRHGRLRSGHRGCPGHRPHAGRMDYRQLLLALDLLHQSSRRPAGAVHGQPVYRRPALPAPCRSTAPSTIWALACMALWLGTLQLVLDKGQEADWFEATWIRWLTARFRGSPAGLHRARVHDAATPLCSCASCSTATSASER